ncbi:inter-alpha-trypsin inhibitor-like [Tachyglossus aculeatus]|uniref:inter-alpha-trypsin inhibitor-like n=1 Tax=Tachyglossus aculeatus TaxID=9261 RepID=UPI0018F79CDA|nr:inter-alpha-trypsin inhibitor-like [Tachyglossus aculeatus]
MDEGEAGVNLGYRLFYNRTTDRCHPFLYKGSGGNGNRFISDKQCMRNCSTLAKQLYPDNEQACTLEQDSGFCKGSYVMWYFDKKEKKCLTFFYGGCSGNGNRFWTKNECYQRCSPNLRGKAVEENDDGDEGVDIGLVLGIVVGCVAAIALIMTTIFFIQEKKKEKESQRKGKESTQLNIELNSK